MRTPKGLRTISGNLKPVFFMRGLPRRIIALYLGSDGHFDLACFASKCDSSSETEFTKTKYF